MNKQDSQHQKLNELITYVGTHSAFYKRLFQQNNIETQQINSIADLQKIPFTSKEDLQASTADFMCVPKNKLVDYVTTSGTTGKPLTLALTDADLDRLALNEYNSFKIAGLDDNDIIQLMTTIDRRFMAGMAYFLGARKLGAGIIRVGNGLPQLQWDTIAEVNPTVLVCVPSFIIKLIEFAEANNIDYKSSSVKKIICIGEAIRYADFSLNALGKNIFEKWPVELYSTYASSEMATAFTECSAFNGGHLQEDLLVAEIIDENGQPVNDGEAGELVVTTLGIEGMPLVRFKTGDIFMAHSEACPCGRTSLRLGPLLGRKKQMIKYKGTSLYPNALYDVLDSIGHIKNYQVQVDTNRLGTDDISIAIGIKENQDSIAAQIKELLRAKLRVAPELKFFTPEHVNSLLVKENSRKPIKFIDNRKN